MELFCAQLLLILSDLLNVTSSERPSLMSYNITPTPALSSFSSSLFPALCSFLILITLRNYVVDFFPLLPEKQLHEGQDFIVFIALSPVPSTVAGIREVLVNICRKSK